MTTQLLDELTAALAAHGVSVGASDKVTIGSDDTLFVIDMQHDFVPGGAFGVAEGNHAEPTISQLIGHFAEKKANILASRDYHPANHCSFACNGGPFPPHCVQGSKGAEFVDSVASALNPLVADGRAHIVFKGFSKDVDSFGAIAYPEEVHGSGRITKNNDGKYCGTCWTGGYVLYSSTQKGNVNAPPDVMSILDKKSIVDVIGAPSASKRFFVCGLAFDFCVLDTALNAAAAGYSNVTIVIDASRAAHIPGFGQFGSGFLSDPAALATKLKQAGVSLTHSSALL
jgi:nicotinamidase-related amidase